MPKKVTLAQAIKQRDAAVAALIAIKQDLQCNGECFVTDEARIARLNRGILESGYKPSDSDLDDDG
jgi:hypothetical protein